jgi:hypothetical protein
MEGQTHGAWSNLRLILAQLRVNIAYQVEARKLWVELGLYP